MLNDTISYIETLCSQSVEGSMNPLSSYALLKTIEKALEKSIEQVKQLAILEAEKYPEKSIKYSGFKFELSYKKYWEYKHIPEWAEIESKRKEIEERAKMAAMANLDINGSTGEVILQAYSKSVPSIRFLG